MDLRHADARGNDVVSSNQAVNRGSLVRVYQWRAPDGDDFGTDMLQRRTCADLHDLGGPVALSRAGLSTECCTAHAEAHRAQVAHEAALRLAHRLDALAIPAAIQGRVHLVLVCHPHISRGAGLDAQTWQHC